MALPGAALVSNIAGFLLNLGKRGIKGANDDGLGDRENRKKLAARAFLEGYEPDPRLFAKGPDDAPDIVEPEPLVQPTDAFLPPVSQTPVLVSPGAPPVVGGEVDYFVQEVARIDRNVFAIAKAMEANAKADAQYRQSIIADQKEKLAARGKLRSRRREERSKQGFLARGRKAYDRIFGSGKGIGGNLAGFFALEAIDQLQKNFDKLKSQTMEFLRNLPLIGGLFGKPTISTLSPEGSNAVEKAKSMLRSSEGFREMPYYDVNAFRAGYGSDTYTLADGTVKRVEEGVPVTREQAERDLERRITEEFMPEAAKQVGEDLFYELPDDAQAALTSVAYNYGSLPISVVEAVKKGGISGIADAVEQLKTHDGGINARRRMEEAAIIRQSGLNLQPVSQTQPQPGVQQVSYQVPELNAGTAGVEILDAIVLDRKKPKPSLLTAGSSGNTDEGRGVLDPLITESEYKGMLV